MAGLTRAARAGVKRKSLQLSMPLKNPAQQEQQQEQQGIELVVMA
jgi:hypothetical protein